MLDLLKEKNKSMILLATTILLAYTWGMTGLGKLLGGGVPDYFYKRFGETILATVPGIPIAFYSIVILEVVAFILAAVSLIRLEFWKLETFWIRLCVLASSLTFVVLGFGLRLVKDHDGAHNLFVYFGVCLVMQLFLDSIDKA